MKIRTKSTLITVAITLVVFLCLHVFTAIVLNPTFDEVDKKDIYINLNQVKNGLNSKMASLEKNLIDYSSWDDTYGYVLDHNQGFIESNFVDGTFDNLRLNFIAIVDNDRNELYCQFFDLNNSAMVDNLIDKTQIIQDDTIIPRNSQNTTTFSGIVHVNNQPMLVASAPILTSSYDGPSIGRMIFGQYFDSYQINQLESILNFDFSVDPTSNIQSTDYALARDLQSNNQTIVKTLGPNTIAGYTLLSDIHSEPKFVLQVTTERVAYQEGQYLQYLFFLATFILSTAVAIGVFIISERVVVRPMKNLADSVKSIPLTTQRIDQTPKTGSEELSIVSNAVRDTLNKKFEAMNEVSVMVAHDLRNPLAGIKSASYVLKKNYGDSMDEKGKSMLKIIDDCVEYSNKIVTDLLDYSTEIKLSKVATTPKELVDSALTQFNTPDKIKVVNEAGNNCCIVVDKLRIMRVFTNLIKNAFDAMPDGGKLVISSRKVRNRVVVEFADTGIGMSRETLDKLWTPFFTTKAKGMGVGLPICKKIVELHGGKIEVASSVNMGTTFSVYLPINI